MDWSSWLPDFGEWGTKALDWFKGIPEQLISPDFLIPAAVAGGGMYLQNRALQNAQVRQENELAQQLANQQSFQAPVRETIQRQAFERSTPEVERETTALQRRLAGGLDDYLTAARETMPTEARVGRLSSDYTSGLAGMSAEEAARRARLNTAWAGLAAPTQQRFEQGLRDVGHGSTIGAAQSDANTLAQSGQLALARAGQPSGSQLLLGDLLTQGGSALAAGSLMRPKIKPKVPNLGDPANAALVMGRP
jgi:hypothetical protein